MTAAVSVQLLGRFAVRLGGCEQPDAVFGGRLARQLLRMLALSRGALLSKDVAAEALWPTHPPADAAGNVEILVSRLRRALGDRSLIQTGSGGYILAGDDRCWVDVEAFLAAVTRGQTTLASSPAAAMTAFEEALALWRGEPLAEDVYADWAVEHRDHLLRAHLDALEGAATAALTLGDAASAVNWAQTAADAHPLREAATLLLLRALADNGDPAAALTRFDLFRHRLADQLGIDPSDDALELRQQLLSGQVRPQRPSVTRVTEISGSATQRADEREVLALLALMTRPSPADLVARAAGVSLRSVLNTLAALQHRGLVSTDEDGWILTRRAQVSALVDADPVASVRRHLLLAEALRVNGWDPAEIAMHLAAGADRAQAAAAFADAAQLRLNHLANDEALHLCDTGLALAPPAHHRASLWEIHAEASRRRGQFDNARADLDRALVDATGGPRRSQILAHHAILEARTRDAVRGAAVADLAIAEAGNNASALGQALAAAALIDLRMARLDRASHRARQAQRLLQASPDVIGVARLWHWKALAPFVAGRLTDAAHNLGELAGLPSLPETLWLWNPSATHGHVLTFLGQPAAGLAEIDAVLNRARDADQPAIHSECLWHRSEALTELGRVEEAVEAARAGLAIAQRIGHAECTAAALRALGIAAQATGDLVGAETAFRDALRVGHAVPLFGGWASARLGVVLVCQGRIAEAQPLIGAALAQTAPLVRHEARWAHAELLHACGDPGARAASAAALTAARDAGYQALIPRLTLLASA